MIDHMGINVTDLQGSKTFYETALAPLGYRTCMHIENIATGFGADRDAVPQDDPGGDFWIALGTPQTPRVHVAFHAANQAEVRAFYAAALAAGGKDNGAPGLRPHYHANYYAAFIFDPDGYNIEAVCHKPE
ncbi:VOC family protein [Uliginosibacterium gangwonense]|uniref:VOC family protein n=1 Tax=Uliginosibacterium gangwonense TaxID=392736 RepID=UPI00037EB235|nr:VOC family protein [Uliginosibacterium gangwonense]